MPASGGATRTAGRALRRLEPSCPRGGRRGRRTPDQDRCGRSPLLECGASSHRFQHASTNRPTPELLHLFRMIPLQEPLSGIGRITLNEAPPSGDVSDGECAVVLSDDPLTDREPESEPEILPSCLGREARVEDQFPNLLRDPGARVFDGHFDRGLRLVHLPREDADGAAVLVAHRVAGVDEDVCPDLV